MSLIDLISLPNFERQKAYFDANAEAYEHHNCRAETYKWMLPQIHSNIRRFRNQARKQRLTLLDCATGTGDGLVGLNHMDQIERSIGIDASFGMLKEASRRLNSEHQPELVNGNVITMPFGSSSMDILLFKLAFHHFELPWIVLDEVRRVINTPGLIIIADILAPEDLVADEFFYALNRMREPANFRFRPLSVLRFWLEKYGFGCIDVAQTNVTLALEKWLSDPTYFDAARTIEWMKSAPDQVQQSFRFRYDSELETHLLDLTVAVIAARCE